MVGEEEPVNFSCGETHKLEVNATASKNNDYDVVCDYVLNNANQPLYITFIKGVNASDLHRVW